VNPIHPHRANWTRRIRASLGVLVIVYGVLLIPDAEPPPPERSTARPFVWNQDARWENLERRFLEAKQKGCDALSAETEAGFQRLRPIVQAVSETSLPPGDTVFSFLEHEVFSLAPLIAACPDRVNEFTNLVVDLRALVKLQSRQWDMNDLVPRDVMYRLLYGSRAALEEIMLQAPEATITAALICTDEPSQTPAASILGITLHSGDILVSRGGAPTSALISRGNDYPGNFSHVALAHVDLQGTVSIIESHIEVGVAIADIDAYLRDTKLRVMVLRLRSDLPEMVTDPLLPHHAASAMLAESRSRHIPYDFEMDFSDTSRYFCSEVASAAYRRYGITLWMGLSTISSPGVASWLSAFGVRYFDTQEPADLEYDPQLSVVAEWRDPATLFKDHVDNAATDVMLEGAERGEGLVHDWYMLPLARLAKGYSSVLNLFGMHGPVPEGMSATAALKNTKYTNIHDRITSGILQRAREFEVQRGYRPPYWELVKMGRDVKEQL
jgi:hypothetical protein